MATVPSASPFIDELRQFRADAVADTIATLQMEGLDPTPELKRLFEEYIAGKLTSDQVHQAIRRKHKLALR